MSNQPISGQGCKAYIDLGTTAESYTLMKQARNVSLSRSQTAIDVSARYGDVNLFIAGMKQFSVTMEYIYIKGKDDEVLDAIEDSFWNRVVHKQLFAVDDVETNGTKGQDGAYFVSTFDESQELDGAVIYNITFQPGYLEDENGDPIIPRKFVVGEIEPQMAPQVIETISMNRGPEEVIEQEDFPE